MPIAGKFSLTRRHCFARSNMSAPIVCVKTLWSEVVVIFGFNNSNEPQIVLGGRIDRIPLPAPAPAIATVEVRGVEIPSQYEDAAETVQCRRIIGANRSTLKKNCGGLIEQHVLWRKTGLDGVPVPDHGLVFLVVAGERQEVRIVGLPAKRGVDEATSASPCTLCAVAGSFAASAVRTSFWRASISLHEVRRLGTARAAASLFDLPAQRRPKARRPILEQLRKSQKDVVEQEQRHRRVVPPARNHALLNSGLLLVIEVDDRRPLGCHPVGTPQPRSTRGRRCSGYPGRAA